MSQPNPTQLQNQYLPPGQFPGSSPGRGPGAVGMHQLGAQTAVPVVRNELRFFSSLETGWITESQFKKLSCIHNLHQYKPLKSDFSLELMSWGKWRIINCRDLTHSLFDIVA